MSLEMVIRMLAAGMGVGMVLKVVVEIRMLLMGMTIAGVVRDV